MNQNAEADLENVWLHFSKYFDQKLIQTKIQNNPISSVDSKMPEICRFYGIIIHIFTETGVQHHTPHIHIYYQDSRAVYGIHPIELLAGDLPRRQQRLVEAWMELYREELLEDWRLALAGQAVNKIPPLQ